MHSKLYALLATTCLATLGACEFKTLNFDDIPISNEDGCGKKVFPHDVMGGDVYNGIILSANFGSEVVVINTTVTDACPPSTDLGLPYSSIFPSTNIIASGFPAVEFDTNNFDAAFINNATMRFAFHLSPEWIARNYTIVLRTQWTDFGEQIFDEFHYQSGDGPGPYTLVIPNTSGLALLLLSVTIDRVDVPGGRPGETYAPELLVDSITFEIGS